jgi:putative hydrolase of the HAD superfamily
MPFSTIIFDLFGTLVSGRVWLNHDAVVQKMALILGAPLNAFVDLFESETREDREMGVFPTIEANIKFICTQLGIAASPGLINQAALQRYEFTKLALDLRADTISILAWLQENGYKTGLISDCSPDVPPLWLKTPMSKYITQPIFSSNVGLKKPSARIYALAIETYHTSPEQCLYVGDGGSYELTGAKQAGMTPVLLKTPGDEISDRMKPDAVSWNGLTIINLSQVKDLLKNSS